MKEKDQNGKISDYILPEPKNRRLFEPERINIHKPPTISDIEDSNEQNFLPEKTSTIKLKPKKPEFSSPPSFLYIGCSFFVL